eukprot:6205595-Pleurochrysis_carterae.AAC.9
MLDLRSSQPESPCYKDSNRSPGNTSHGYRLPRSIQNKRPAFIPLLHQVECFTKTNACAMQIDGHAQMLTRKRS